MTQDKPRSVKDWLTALRTNQTAAIKTNALKHGATPRSIASIFAHQLNQYFDESKIDFVIFQRTALAGLLSTLALNKKAPQPTLKITVRKYFRAYGIAAYYVGGLIEFRRIEALKDPTF